jgi:hypothetical protein
METLHHCITPPNTALNCLFFSWPGVECCGSAFDDGWNGEISILPEISIAGEPFENILDSNMFTAYIPRDTDIPRFSDPRQSPLNMGTYRHPGHVRSRYINQVFSCIGYIKRIQNLDHKKYLPRLYEELGRFLVVLEDITYSLDIRTSRDIYEAQKRGFEGFSAGYHHQAANNHDQWFDTIRKHQFLYLEKIDMLIETLKARGHVFDCSDEPLYTRILSACRDHPGQGAAADA